MGLLALLHESCRFNSDDRSFVVKATTALARRNEFFRAASARQGRHAAFVVCHSAQDVCYHAAGFVERNRDLLAAHAVDMLRVRVLRAVHVAVDCWLWVGGCSCGCSCGCVVR